MLAEVVIQEKTLHLKDAAVYPRGSGRLELGVREMMALRDQLAQEARELGFERLRITGIRYSGANPGKMVDIVMELER